MCFLELVHELLEMVENNFFAEIFSHSCAKLIYDILILTSDPWRSQEHSIIVFDTTKAKAKTE